MILPLAEIAQGLPNGVAPFLLEARRQLLLLIMEDEVSSIAGARYQRAVRGKCGAGAVGIDQTARKAIFGFHQGASENQTACDSLFADLARRGLELRQPHLNLIDGGKALRAGVRSIADMRLRLSVINFTSTVTSAITLRRRTSRDGSASSRMNYDLRSYHQAKAAWLRIHQKLNHVNPSAARLEEGLGETMTLHRLQVPMELWKTLRSTNVIESAFSIVRVVCRNVKRWRPGNQIERWVGSGLLVAEHQFRRIDGYRASPGLVALLDPERCRSKATGQVA